MNPAVGYARTQADGLDNIAPTSLQGQQAWQYAQSDNFLSAEEASAVMRQQLKPYRAQIESRLAQFGWPSDHLSNHPNLEEALFSGQKTRCVKVWVTPELQLEGRLRIVMTENGPDIRLTPVQRQINIPDEVEGVRLSKGEKQQLMMEGALARPFLMADKGDYVPTYLRIDEQTNTVELWRIRPDVLPTKLMGIDLTKDQQLQLANGHAVRLSGLLDQQGEPFTATVSISAAQKELQFTDVSLLAIGLKPDNENRQQLALNNDGAKMDLTRSQEMSTGQTTVSNHQRETMQQLLEGKPEQKIGSPKQRIQ
jgi:hypothetical protein